MVHMALESLVLCVRLTSGLEFPLLDICGFVVCVCGHSWMYTFEKTKGTVKVEGNVCVTFSCTQSGS